MSLFVSSLLISSPSSHSSSLEKEAEKEGSPTNQLQSAVAIICGAEQLAKTALVLRCSNIRPFNQIPLPYFQCVIHSIEAAKVVALPFRVKDHVISLSKMDSLLEKGSKACETGTDIASIVDSALSITLYVAPKKVLESTKASKIRQVASSLSTAFRVGFLSLKCISTVVAIKTALSTFLSDAEQQLESA